MENFKEIKDKIKEFGHKHGACIDEYSRVINSCSMTELCQVIKDNFNWCCGNPLEFAEIIKAYTEEFASEQIYCNQNVNIGYLLASGNATVKASGNATVKASGNATVEASDNATVKAWGNATVKASGNVYILIYNRLECKLNDKAIARYYHTEEVKYSGDIKFIKVNNE